MFPLPNYLMVITSIGHAIIFSLALSGFVQIVAALLGTPLPEESRNGIFLISSLVTAPPAAYFRIARFVLPAESQRPR